MLLLLVLATVGLAIGGAAYACAAHHPRSTRFAIPALLALLCGRALLSRFPAWEWALFPWPSYAHVQGFTLYPLAMAFFGLAAARLPVRWNRVLLGCVALGVLGHGLHRHAWLAWPEAHGDERAADARHHLRQSTIYTCGPAACAAVLAHCGVQVTEREMARLCLTRRGGSSLFDLYRGVVVALATQPFVVSIEDLSAEDLLACDHLAVCSNSGGGHAVSIVTRNGEVTVHDPLLPAPVPWSRSQLQRDYRGPAIVVRPVPAAATPR